jgi:hypothetical protein
MSTDVVDGDRVIAIVAKHLFGGGVRGESSRAGAVVHPSACWRLLLLAEQERAAARGSLLVVVHLSSLVATIRCARVAGEAEARPLADRK